MMSNRIKVIILTLFLAAGSAPAAWAEGENVDTEQAQSQGSQTRCQQNTPTPNKSDVKGRLIELENRINKIDSICESLSGKVTSLSEKVEQHVKASSEEQQEQSPNLFDTQVIAWCSLAMSALATILSVFAVIQLFRKSGKEEGPAEKPTENKKVETEQTEQDSKKQQKDWNNFHPNKKSKRGQGEQEHSDAKEEEPAQKVDERKPEAEQKEEEEAEPSKPSEAESAEPDKEPKPTETPTPEAPHIYMAYNTDGKLKKSETGMFEVDEDNKTFRFTKDLSILAYSADNYRRVIKVTGDKKGRPVRQIEGMIEIETSGKKWAVAEPIVIEFK